MPTSDNNYKSGRQIDDRKVRFAKINSYIFANGGFVVSIPGSPELVFEVLPHSPIPAKLIELGYDVRPADPPEGQRILGAAITERLALSSSGALVPLTEESTKAVAEIRTHAGIVRVTRFSFGIG